MKLKAMMTSRACCSVAVFQHVGQGAIVNVPEPAVDLLGEVAGAMTLKHCTLRALSS